jgi:sporulation protein YlmC with PRC-barrel domain
MTKKLMLGAALSALLVSGALAQQPAPSASPPLPAAQDKAPAMQDKAPAAQDKPLATQDNAQSNPSGGKPDFVMAQKPDQWLASKFRGTDVLGADGKKIGDVSDILFDKTGKIEAFVVSVGGILGMGAKQVALAPSAFDVVPGENGAADKLKVSVSQDALKQAQNFTPYAPPHPTTTGTSTSPLGRSPSNSGPTQR